MKKMYAVVAIIFTTALLAMPFSAAWAQPSTQQVRETMANTAIDRARFLLSVKKPDEAREVLIDVLQDTGLSDETRGRAYLQMGGVGMNTSDYKAAKRAYQSALDLAGISSQLRGAAKFGFETAESFEKLRQK